MPRRPQPPGAEVACPAVDPDGAHRRLHRVHPLGQQRPESPTARRRCPLGHPGLPVVLTNTSPSGRLMMVRWPLSTSRHPKVMENFRAADTRSPSDRSPPSGELSVVGGDDGGGTGGADTVHPYARQWRLCRRHPAPGVLDRLHDLGHHFPHPRRTGPGRTQQGGIAARQLFQGGRQSPADRVPSSPAGSGRGHGLVGLHRSHGIKCSPGRRGTPGRYRRAPPPGRPRWGHRCNRAAADQTALPKVPLWPSAGARQPGAHQGFVNGGGLIFEFRHQILRDADGVDLQLSGIEHPVSPPAAPAWAA